MLAIIKRELRLGLKNLLIWSITVGGLGLICTLMYSSMDGDMQEMAEQFSQMGAFADAFGMSTLSIASINGFFATGSQRDCFDNSGGKVTGSAKISKCWFVL